MIEFGLRLKKLRNNANLTQAELARKLDLTKSVISAYENDTRLPSYDVLIHISKIFHVTTDYLLGVEAPTPVDLSGLSEEEAMVVTQLIKVLKHKR